MCELSSPEIHLPRETDCGIVGSAEPVYSRRRPCRHRCLELTVFGFPGVPGDGMPGKNVQRKLGTTRGSPRRSRTAKASRISRQAVKSRCAREWGGWGRVSDDGPGHYNPDPSEGPWGRWSIPPHGGAVIASTDPTLCGSTLKHEGRRQTDRRSADAGSRLKLIDASGRSRLIRQPFSRNGENSPYGMLGGIVERSSRQGRSLAGCKSPYRQLPVVGRLAYPMRGEATNRVLLGRKSPGCPAGVFAAVGTIWGASKLGGRNITKYLQPRKSPRTKSFQAG